MLLTESDVASLLPMDAAIGIMEQALAAFSAGAVLQPVRQALVVEPHGGYLGLMPAHVRGGAAEALGERAVTFYTRTADRDLPTHLAIILLWDTETGVLLAIMDGRLITEMRTAGPSAP